jgi:hypothetical protein
MSKKSITVLTQHRHKLSERFSSHYKNLMEGQIRVQPEEHFNAKSGDSLNSWQ